MQNNSCVFHKRTKNLKVFFQWLLKNYTYIYILACIKRFKNLNTKNAFL